MRADHQSLSPGTELGPYRIDGIIGTGGFGITYLGHDRDLDRAVAIKEYFPVDLAIRERDGRSLSARTDALEEGYNYGLSRFVDEARTLAKFQHPNIVRVNHFEQSHGTAYLVMEYARGETLADVLKRGPQLAHDILETLRALMDGLETVHGRDILHRDVKPANIVMQPGRGPVLLDFGAARESLNAVAGDMTVILTPGYAPLEQYGDTSDLGPWTDIYAVGATLFECLIGHAPEEVMRRLNMHHDGLGDPVQMELNAASNGTNELIVELVEWMMQPRITDRPRSCADVLAELAAAEDALQANTIVRGSPGASAPPHTVAPEDEATVLAPAEQELDLAIWSPSDEELSSARTFLADHLGPIAGILVKRAAATANDEQHFAEILAEDVADQAVRTAWLARFASG